MPLGNPLARGKPRYSCVLFSLTLPWRWSGGRRGPTRASAPTGCRRESGEWTPHLPPRRGGCPHPPASRPPSTTKQSASGFSRAGLSISIPKFPPDWQPRHKTHETEQTGASRQKTTQVLSAHIQKSLVFKQTCTHVQVLRQAIFSLGPSTAHSLFVKNKKRMGGGLPG